MPTRKGSKKGRVVRKSKKKELARSHAPTMPKTQKLASKRSAYKPRKRVSKASTTMTKTELEFMAKSKGIPFGGLNKTQLVRKINAYDF